MHALHTENQESYLQSRGGWGCVFAVEPILFPGTADCDRDESTSIPSRKFIHSMNMKEESAAEDILHCALQAAHADMVSRTY